MYQAFVDVFNAMLENKDYFVGKWRERMESNELLVKYKAKQFIGIMAQEEIINAFDVNLYFALVKKMTVYDGGSIIVSLLDGTDVECEI